MTAAANEPGGARAGAPAAARGESDIEREIRAAYARRLEACERVRRFGEDALTSWAGRTIDPASVDSIILAEAARATKTYGGALDLVAGGFGPQAMMLNRPLFEGMAVAHWARANPARAVDLFLKHGRHAELLWRDALERADPEAARGIEPGSKAERNQLSRLFGKQGTNLWTGHRSLFHLLPDIEDQWPAGEMRAMLWLFFRIVNRDSSEVLHRTPLGPSDATRTTEHLGLDAGPSAEYLDRVFPAALWSYMQTLTLLWDHFEIPNLEELDAIFTAADEVFREER